VRDKVCQGVLRRSKWTDEEVCERVSSVVDRLQDYTDHTLPAQAEAAAAFTDTGNAAGRRALGATAAATGAAAEGSLPLPSLLADNSFIVIASWSPATGTNTLTRNAAPAIPAACIDTAAPEAVCVCVRCALHFTHNFYTDTSSHSSIRFF
jgi:hypothetical protein